MSEKPIIVNKQVHRPAASATWTHAHRWGTSFGDSTDLRVTRTDGGPLRISYGKESIEIRKALVGVLADMVAAAAAWSDTPPALTDETEAAR